MSESQYRVEWLDDPQVFHGDISASMSLGRDHWRAVGAPFTQLEDDQTGPFEMAAGTVEFPGGAVEFGLLDFGSDVTYLLTPASGVAKEEMATLALVALAEIGVLSLDDVLDESNPYEEPSLTERISALETWAGEAIAKVETSAVPVAVDLEMPIEPTVNIQRYVQSRVGSVSPGIRHVGTLKAFDLGKGGVIEPQGGGKEIFVPPSVGRNLQDLAAGAVVTFRYTIKTDLSEAEARVQEFEAESAEDA